jgi:hypothetical protein
MKSEIKWLQSRLVHERKVNEMHRRHKEELEAALRRAQLDVEKLHDKLIRGGR